MSDCLVRLCLDRSISQLVNFPKVQSERVAMGQLQNLVRVAARNVQHAMCSVNGIDDCLNIQLNVLLLCVFGRALLSQMLLKRSCQNIIELKHLLHKHQAQTPMPVLLDTIVAQLNSPSVDAILKLLDTVWRRLVLEAPQRIRVDMRYPTQCRHTSCFWWRRCVLFFRS